MNKREYLKESLKQINEFHSPIIAGATLLAMGSTLLGPHVKGSHKVAIAKETRKRLSKRYPHLSSREISRLTRKAMKSMAGKEAVNTAFKKYKKFRKAQGFMGGLTNKSWRKGLWPEERYQRSILRGGSKLAKVARKYRRD